MENMLRAFLKGLTDKADEAYAGYLDPDSSRAGEYYAKYETISEVRDALKDALEQYERGCC